MTNSTMNRFFWWAATALLDNLQKTDIHLNENSEMFLGSLHWPSQGRKREKPFVLITVNRHIFHFRIIFKPCWQQKSAHKSATLLTCELHWIPRLSIKCFVSAIPNIISKCNLTSNVFAFKSPPPLLSPSGLWWFLLFQVTVKRSMIQTVTLFLLPAVLF